MRGGLWSAEASQVHVLWPAQRCDCFAFERGDVTLTEKSLWLVSESQEPCVLVRPPSAQAACLPPVPGPEALRDLAHVVTSALLFP